MRIVWNLEENKAHQGRRKWGDKKKKYEIVCLHALRRRAACCGAYECILYQGCATTYSSFTASSQIVANAKKVVDLQNSIYLLVDPRAAIPEAHHG